MKYPFTKHILVCTGARCNDEKRGEDRSEFIRAELKDLNKMLGRKRSIRICAVSCLDLCDHGPNIIVEPEGVVYSHLTRTTARRVYDAAVGDGPSAEEYELTESEFREAREKPRDPAGDKGTTVTSGGGCIE
jgi:(2Fe-2S) ferredoxin